MNNTTKFFCALSSFVAGFSLMTLELVFSRIVAPLIGTSVYTWTAVIGITLLGLSIGNYIGGVISDRVNPSRALPLSFIASAFFTSLLPFFSQKTQFILNSSSSLPLLTILLSIYLFLVPAIMLGLIQPIVVKKYVDDFLSLGKKYGWLSSLWSLGSILGVFITGFFFISYLGSKETVYFTALLLAFIGLAAALLFKEKKILVVATIALVFIGFLLFINSKSTPQKGIVYAKETAYFSAKVIDSKSSLAGNTRVLMLDYDSHSIEAPEPLRSTQYTAVAPLFQEFNRAHKIKDILVIGAGAYTLPKDLKNTYPESKVTVIEIDPEVVEISKKYFGLDTSKIDTKIGDARVETKKMSTTYDLIFADAYNSFISVPGHLLTKEYTSSMKQALTPGGMYAINFISAVDGENSSMFKSILATFKTVFPNYYVLHWNVSEKAIQNVVIVGINSSLHISEELLTKRLSQSKNPYLARTILFEPETYLDPEAIILTDNFHPVERLMAPAITTYYPRFRQYNENLYR